MQETLVYFSGAEPLTCKKIDQYIRLCKKIGYEHIYISTNGSIGNFNKLKDIVDAGISSIKFSINAGKKETYKDVHGKDDFEKVINNVKNISKYKNENDSKFWLSVSFVGMKNTKNEFPILKKILKDSVDEIVYYDASNQSGQMKDFPDPPYTDCHLPFNKAHFSVEGYMKACCNDYENLLVVDDINGKDILSIWNGPRFKTLRKQHLDDKLSNTLCANCIRSQKTIAEPINKKLHAKSQKK